MGTHNAKLGMTESEICAIYRSSKNKSAQIPILAQLSLTSTDHIRQILMDNGYLPQEAAPTPPVEPPAEIIWEKISTPAESTVEAFEARLMAMAAEGLTARQMAQELSMSVSTVYKYLNRYGLSPGRPPRQIRDTNPQREQPLSTDSAPPVENSEDLEATPPVAEAAALSQSEWRALRELVALINRAANAVRGGVIEEKLGLTGVRAERLCVAMSKLESAVNRLRPPEED